MAKNIMARRGESITAHPSIVSGFVCSLTKRSKSYNYITSLNIVFNNFTLANPGCYSAVNYDSSHQVTHIGSFAAGGMDSYSVIAHHCKTFFGAFDNCTDGVSGETSATSGRTSR